MKKIASLALAALAILACQREVDTPKPERAVPTHTVTITARLAPDTKTTYDEAGKFAWVAGDQIHILAVNGDAKKQFVFTTADGGPEVQFTGEVEDGFQLTSEAAYALEFDADKKVWVLPESVNQHPAKPLANLPLFGFEDRDHLYQFITATGIVKFTVENVPIATASATLETLGEDAPSLCGELAAAPADGVVTLAALAGGQVLHTVDAPIAPNTTMSFYFFVPAGTLPAEKTQFALRDAEDAAIKSFVFQKDVEVQANRITNIAPIVLDVEIIRNRETDSLALVAIYNASKGAEWSKNKWELSTPIDTWPAVTVTDDRVTALKLSTSGVITSEWTLPEEIGDLTELTDLRINSNKLTGELPESLYSLTKLEFLYFQNNNITGALSSKLGQLTELTQLYVDRNANMTGGIPKEIGNLKKLARINISQSGIGGEIPAELGQCEALMQFMAFKTNLSGTLPDIWDLPVLQTVMLYGNPGLTGELPSSLGKVKATVNGSTVTAPSLQLHQCNFTGNIPESFAGLHEKTKQVFVQENKMSGVIPAAVQAHPNFANWKYSPQQEGYELLLEPAFTPRQLDSLALVAIYNASKGAEWSKNKWELSTPIDTWPAVTVTDDRVTALKLSTSGVITSEWTLPEEIGELTELTDLRINSNKLTGDLPESLYSLTKLENLYFQNDNLTGALSEKLGQLTELVQLYVDRNANMTGGIPKAIGNLKKLQRINISQTGIGGEIPAELGQCEALLQFMAFKTNLSGTLPDIWDMPVLQTVMLHTNPGITGELPASLSKLKPIVNGTNVTAPSIQIYACNLTGNIPECFANLHEKTKQVYVENNKMSGVIPAAVQAHPGFSSWRWDPQQEGYELLLEAPVTYSRQTDSLALVAIYNAAKGAEWKSDRVWDLTKPMDEWYGVKLTEGRVTTLNLASGTISNAWEIPAEIGDLQELTNLRFVNDKVTGSFPEEIYTLSKLESLYLTNNTLSWSISPKMANLTALKDLYIDQNANLTGTLPKELGQMKKLVNINISKTSVSGAIPTEMTGCDALKNFMAFNAQLTSMEDNWDQWPALEIIMIYGNAGLEGPLPESVSRSTTIKTIRFDDCNFTGNIPESYANIPARQGSATTQLWLKGNKLSGVVPAAVQAHENWQPKNAWKYETNILPQQEGFGLTLE